MSRVIAVMACGFMLTACSATMPSLDFLKSTPQPETLAIESEPPGAEAKTSLGESCRMPCKLSVQPGSEADGAAAAPRLAPNPVRVDLRPATPAKKLVAKKKKPVAAAARPAAPPPMASAASPPTPAPAPAPALAPAPSAPTEAAPSATNYPWPSR